MPPLGHRSLKESPSPTWGQPPLCQPPGGTLAPKCPAVAPGGAQPHPESGSVSTPTQCQPVPSHPGFQEVGSAAGPPEAPWSQVRSTLSHPAPTGQVGHRHGPCVESNWLQGEADVVRERPLCPSPYFLSPQPHWAGSSDLSKSLVPAEQRRQGSGPHPAPSSSPPHPTPPTWALNTMVLCVLRGFFRHHPAPAPWRQAVPSGERTEARREGARGPVRRGPQGAAGLGPHWPWAGGGVLGKGQGRGGSSGSLEVSSVSLLIE